MASLPLPLALTSLDLSSAITAFQPGESLRQLEWAAEADLHIACGHISLVELLAHMHKMQTPKSVPNPNPNLNPSLNSNSSDIIVTPRAYTKNPNGLPEQVFWWLQFRGVVVPPSYGDLCAKIGDATRLLWLREHTNMPCTLKAGIYAAQSGNIQMLDLLFHKFSLPKNSRFMDAAVDSGKLSVVRYLCDCGVTCTERVFLRAMEQGKPHVARLLAGHMLAMSQNAIDKAACLAAANGMMREVIWLKSKMARFTLDKAASRGHIRMVQYLHEHCEARATVKAMTKAAVNGHLEVVRFLYHNRSEGSEANVMDLCAEAGQLLVLMWLHENAGEYECSTEALDAAAKNGHYKVVEWLHTHRQDGATTDAMDNAAGGGFLDIVQYLHNNRAEGATVQAFDLAAQGGHLQVLTWLQSHGYTGTHRAVDWAAQNGHLEVVKLLVSAGWGYTRAAYDWSAAMGHKHIMEWLRDNCNECFSTAAVELAAREGHLSVLQWLLKHDRQLFTAALRREPTTTSHCAVNPNPKRAGGSGSDGDLAMDLSIRNGHVHVCVWLLGLGFMPSRQSFDWAARNGHIEMLVWLKANTSIRPTRHAIEWAVLYEKIDVVHWMIHHGLASVDAAVRHAKLHGHDYIIDWLRPVNPNPNSSLNFCANASIMKE